MEDNFIKENNEKKALKLAFKKLTKKISVEITEDKKMFGRLTKRILILGKNHAHLLFAIMEKALDENGTLDLSYLDLFDLDKSELHIWGLPIYVSSEDDVIMSVGSLGNLFDSNFMQPFIKNEDGSYIDALDMDALIAELPEESKFKKV